MPNARPILPKSQKPSRPHPWPTPRDVKRSHIAGRGLFTTIPLQARQKIGEFTGELITQREGRKRAKRQTCIAIVEVNNHKSIDAAKETTGFRFINHSCSPNTFMRIIRERAEFYMLQTIHAGTELTVNCHPSHHNETLPCQCRSVNCRKLL